MQITNWLMTWPAENPLPSDSAQVKDAPNMKKPLAMLHSTTDDRWRTGRNGTHDEDARQLGPEALHRLRNEIVLQHLQGKSRTQICATCNVSYTAVRKIIHLYQSGGMDALVPKSRGRRSGEKRSLSDNQEQHIRQHIAESGLQSSDAGCVLWDRAAVSALVKREFRISLPLRTMDHYLQRWGFKPNPEVFNHARKEPQCQALLARSKVQNISILWVQLAYLNWPPDRPLDVSQAASTRAIFGTNNRNQTHWGVIANAAPAASLVSYCETIRALNRGQLLILVAIAEPSLRRTLEQWLAQNKEAVECYYLPEMQRAEYPLDP